MDPEGILEDATTEEMNHCWRKKNNQFEQTHVTAFIKMDKPSFSVFLHLQIAIYNPI